MYRRKRKSGGTALAVLLAIIVIGVCIYATQDRNKAYEYTDTGHWIVAQGDTLWTIAQRHSDNRHDVRKVIYEMQQLTPGLTANIHPGQTIVVPLYDCMDWEYYEED